MLRFAALVIGASFILLGFGIVQSWNGFLPEHPLYLFAATGILWVAALWKWQAAPALISLGSVILATGAVCFFVYPNVVDRGSGQDALVLFVLGFTFLCGIIGLTFLTIGLVLRKTLPDRVNGAASR